MDLTLTEDQELIRSTARELLEARCPMSHVRAMADDPAGYSPELWKEMVELGWTGLAVPEASGGVGAGFLDACLLIEEMGRSCLPSPFAATVAGCGPPITAFGTDTQRQEWLGAIARGRIMTAAGVEAVTGWGPSTSDLVATPAGDGYALEGTAWFVPWSRVAEDLLVAARLAGVEEDAVVVLVDAASPGITREPLEVVGPHRQDRVGFSGVSVAGDRTLGEAGRGREVIEAMAAFGTAAAAAEMVGGAQRVLDMTLEYAGEREQFGKPIGSFQAVQHHCADMAIDVLSARFIAYEAIWRLSEGRDAAMETSMAKAWVSEAYQRVCALGHQVHGAIGFTAEHDLHFFFRHALALGLRLGDGDFHTGRVARLLGL